MYDGSSPLEGPEKECCDENARLETVQGDARCMSTEGRQGETEEMPLTQCTIGEPELRSAEDPGLGQGVDDTGCPAAVAAGEQSKILGIE